jgi:hypothetical protein
MLPIRKSGHIENEPMDHQVAPVRPGELDPRVPGIRAACTDTLNFVPIWDSREAAAALVPAALGALSGPPPRPAWAQAVTMPSRQGRS